MHLFVAGTDTGVGKTQIAAALLHLYRQAGWCAVGMKPVAAGTRADGSNEDVAQLRAASNVMAERTLINPCLLREALAPHIAAKHEGAAIDFAHIARCFEELRGQADVVVVEGVGGFRVPLGDDRDSADLACRLALPVIMVVGLRLGCLNHALLTEEAIRARGLPLAGWVASQVDPHMACVEENREALRLRLMAPLLGFVAYQPQPDPATVAGMLDLGSLSRGGY